MATEVLRPPEALTEPVRRQRRRRRWLHRRTWPVHVALVATCILLIAPIAYAALVSTQTNAQVAGFQLLPGGAFGRNLDVVIGRDLGGFMWRSTVVAVIITVAKTVTALGCGLAFTYLRFPGKWIVFGFVLITLMMPTEISIIALLRIVDGLGWSSSLAALTVPFFASATGAFLFRQHFASMPAELSEAAQLDGASPLQFLVRILIPLSWNTIGALAVIQFVYGWNMYLWPLLAVNDMDSQLIQVGLGSFQRTGQSESYGPLMLATLLASLPPLVVFVVLQKPFMRGFAFTRDA